MKVPVGMGQITTTTTLSDLIVGYLWKAVRFGCLGEKLWMALKLAVVDYWA